MEKIISTYIEEPSEPLFFVDEKENKNNLTRCPADLIRVHKTVRMFDEGGNMHVRHYTEEEWNSTTEVELHPWRGYASRCTVRHMAFNVLIQYFNWCLSDLFPEEIIEEIEKEEFDIKYSDLDEYCKKFIAELKAWIETGQEEPFVSDMVPCTCSKVEFNDGSGDCCYNIDFFGDVKK